ncbi:MAG: NifB/NifX family molybdenum-iron cluster-binding protein [Bacteroidales bacterium]|jgi:predicted Fe-Mo cluster-binding NifX family protein|nr:NifB/NifX family molybdenum-iron cluster-binding protein [Bacteroidales bacterium]MDD4545179.1 NifB/NifX family molybdenum-iron cluster-binding protein [Bacteroidales bacterium]MDY0054276.1 NifB/NifX family molybdenum-iron cluster-binding protein [Bacteroidales bacterium]
MKVAITSKGNTLDSVLDTRFGRCSYFAIYDTESKKLEFVENPNLNANEGAGPSSVKLIASYGVKKAVSGEFGFKIKSLMDDLSIQMIIVNEEKTINEIVELLNK